MKKILYILIIGAVFILSPEVFAQKGIGTNQPDKSAALDIVSTKRGLLIPRIALESINSPNPVTAPLHSLLVFNNGEGGVDEGFYWWSSVDEGGEDKWIAMGVSPQEPGEAPELDIEGIGVIHADDPNDDNNWKISITGENENDVLVTNDQGEAVWTSIYDFIQDVNIIGENGLTALQDPLTGEWIVKLGGTPLMEDLTTIETDFDEKQLAITNLTDITDDYSDILDDGNGEDIFVVVLQDDGVLKKIHIDEFLESIPIDSDYDFLNGLTQAGDQVKLGGPLTEATTITTTDEHTLAIAGLEEESANRMVTIDDDDVLRVAPKTITIPMTGTLDLGADLNYSPYALEINIDLDLAVLDAATGDINLNLPDPAAAEGQIINVKLTGTGEPDHYLNIQDGGVDPLTYGAMMDQGWVLKSNGTNWRVVSSN